MVNVSVSTCLVRLGRISAALAVAGVVVVLAGASPAGAQITWSSINAPLPPDAVASQGMTLSSSSCPVDGWCVAVGNYPAGTADSPYVAGLIDLESGGSWTASEAPLPPGASSSEPQVFLQTVTCAAVGSCIAVGRYVDASGATQGLVEVLSGDLWSPMEAVLPAGSQSSGPDAYAELTDVDCTSATWCTALGVFTAGTGSVLAFFETLSSGTSSATPAPLPVTATGSQLFSLSCPGPGSCVAAGSYLEGWSQEGVIDTLSGGVWTSSSAPLPAGASATAEIANDDLSVSCWAVGSCVLAGTGFGSATYFGFLDTLSAGGWTSVSAPTPGGVASSDQQLDSVSCADATTCVAVGLVTVSGVEQGLMEVLSAGAWVPLTAPLPAGSPANGDINLGSVACPADATCVVDGQSDIGGTVTALFWNLSGGTWVVSSAPLPPDATANPDPSFATFTCPASGACVAVGSYIGASGREGVVETDPSLPPTKTTPSLAPLTTSTVVYSATVTASGSGPTGTVVFSSGAEPLCIATLSRGVATCTGPVAPWSVVLASYSGNGVLSPSWGGLSNPLGPTTLVATAGTPQSAKVGTAFAANLQVQVTNAAGAPVPGVVVKFTSPQKGASGTFSASSIVVTNALGLATAPMFSANAKTGSYAVVAATTGLTSTAGFDLTNKAK